MSATADKPPLLEPAFVRRLERLTLAARRVRMGVSKGERRSKRRGASVEFADYRDYVQGDDLRHIDWNVYARLDELYLKLFEATEDCTLHLIVDASRSMGFGTPTKLDFAKRLGAAIGYIGLGGYDRVGVTAFAGGETRIMTPMRGKASARKLFGFLDALEAEGGTQLEAACRAHALRKRNPGVTVIISDLLDEGGYADGLKRLVSARSELYVVQVLAPEERDPNLSGDLKLIDCETGHAVEISVSRALLKQYADNRDQFIQGVRDWCLARNAGHFLVGSDTPLEELTLDILRRGGMLK